ncbi:hypothetical protein [Marinobacter maritimus]|uniref:hypothetical protein n=1 Tax=Marinobacter maritimus TaxID=277961 RepID=UPI0011A19103|nr:hypothetical protein [Marinobacter maritimus]
MQAALIQHHCREVGSGFCMERGGSTWRQEESVTEFLCAYGAPIMRYLKRKEGSTRTGDSIIGIVLPPPVGAY